MLVSGLMERQTRCGGYPALSRSDEDIDQALVFVQGSFVAAAKLLDMEPRQFRNRINHCPWLKAKWGKSVGRPPIRYGFEIVPYEPAGLIERRQLNGIDRLIVAMIRRLDRRRVLSALMPLDQEARTQSSDSN